MIDSFLTIRSKSEALFKEKASKFYAYAFPVSNTEEVDSLITQLKKEHPKARHFCYAYFLEPDRQLFRANDDGEPSGTAGRPILGQLEKHALTNTVIVVVRYFGGTKLGASGLIQAYKQSAALVLEEASIVKKLITDIIKITSTYEDVGPLMSMVSSQNLNIIDTSYGKLAIISVEIRKSETSRTIAKLKSLLLNRPIEDIKEDTEVENVSFEVTESP